MVTSTSLRLAATAAALLTLSAALPAAPAAADSVATTSAVDLSGAVATQVVAVGSCGRWFDTDWSSTFELTMGEDLWLFQIQVNNFRGPGAYRVVGETTGAASVELTDGLGTYWASPLAGVTGQVEIDPGETSGRLEAQLVNPKDNSTVQAKGAWTCEVW